jgi:hypothetical protein
MQGLQTGNGCAAGIASPIGGAARPYNPIGREIGMEWKDQYRHPNWQRKRLEALEAADYTCQRCYDTETQLHVHHKRYVKGRLVWEYGLDELDVLCVSCHDETHRNKGDLAEILTAVSSSDIPKVSGLLAGFLDADSKASFLSDYDEMVYSKSLAIGIAASIMFDRLENYETILLFEAINKHSFSEESDTTISFVVGPRKRIVFRD